MQVLIITGGSISQDFAVEFIKKNHFDRMIAVDGGLEFADRITCEPFPLTDIVGDFDTIAPQILSKYQAMADGPKIHRYIPEKDNTDTDIALRLAIEICRESDDGKNQIYILGATGTRLDHVLANITMLRLPYEAGIDAYIQDANNRICLLHGTKTIYKAEQFGKYVSLIPLTPKLKGITLSGVKYPLDHHEICQGDSLCVSNEIVGEMATLTVEEGIAVLLETQD